MTTEAQIEAAARSDAAFDGRGWEAMGRTDRDRYLARSRAALEAAERAAWRPISEKPSGVPVLVFTGEMRKGIPPYVQATSHISCGVFFPNTSIVDGLFGFDRAAPTHFRPLPAPPEGTPEADHG